MKSRRRACDSPRVTQPPRSGVALYSSVMATALLVSVLGLAGLTVVRIERRQAQATDSLLVARQNARSALELGLHAIGDDPNWRTSFTNGVETSPVTLGANGTGTLSWIIEDTDGSLTDADTELRIKGVGRVGATVQVTSVEISGTPQVINSLECSTYALGNVTQTSNSTTSAGPFATAASITVNGDVIGDVEGTPVVISGTGSVSGTVTDPGPARTMPPASVWDTYAAMATTIPFTNFPLDVTNPTKRYVDRDLIGKTVNPYGPTNSEGVYLVQVPAGMQLEISKSRLHCTLLVDLGLNARCNTTQSCLWDPPEGKNYPAAIVRGTTGATFELKSSNATLKEGQSPKFNYNPPGEPYEGVSNTTVNDQFPPKMHGLFHVIGSQVHTTLASNLELIGVVIAEGTMTLGANLTVTRDPAIFTNPPLGYVSAGGELEPVVGSWIREAAP